MLGPLGLCVNIHHDLRTRERSYQTPETSEYFATASSYPSTVTVSALVVTKVRMPDLRPYIS